MANLQTPQIWTERARNIRDNWNELRGSIFAHWLYQEKRLDGVIILYITIVLLSGETYHYQHPQPGRDITQSLERCYTVERKFHDVFGKRLNLRLLQTRCGNRTRTIYWSEA